jgi:MFS family permease
MSVVNLIWIRARFDETLKEENRSDRVERLRLRHPLKAMQEIESPAIKLINFVGFSFALAFCAMEFSLTFLGQDRFGFTARENGIMLAFLGFCSIITQGVIVRRLLKTRSEISVLLSGLIFSTIGFALVGIAPNVTTLYLGLAVLALGAGLVNPATSGLISLYAGATEQGRILGIFRSLGSLARAITPIAAGVMFWMMGGPTVFAAAAALSLGSWWVARRLPPPVK